jgi:hypothetical protein
MKASVMGPVTASQGLQQGLGNHTRGLVIKLVVIPLAAAATVWTPTIWKFKYRISICQHSSAYPRQLARNMPRTILSENHS